MRYEYIIGLRYLLSNRSVREPTVIGGLTVAGIALSTGVMIIVLSVMGGFEGDLREKIVGTHAHMLVSGPDMSVIEDPEALIEAIDGHPHVTGVSPFVESELMVSSATNYSGLVLRGLDVSRPRAAADFRGFMVEGDLAWLNDSDRAIDARQFDGFQPRSGNSPLEDIDELTRQIESTRREIEQLRRNAERGLDSDGNPLDPALRDWDAQQREQDDALRQAPRPVGGTTIPLDGLDRGEPPYKRFEPEAPTPKAVPALLAMVGDSAEDDGGMPSLPAPRGQASADDDGGMPSLPAPRGQASADDDGGMPSLPGTSGEGDGPSTPTDGGSQTLPGVVIGQEMQRTLNVLVGDTVNLISPDGDLGPSGPIPRSRPYRVVGVFYTGYYLYDSGMGIVDIDAARSLLNIPSNEVTGIEVRTADLNTAHKVSESLRARLVAEGFADAEVRDWRSLNRSLFAALTIERIAVSAVLTFFIAISGLLVLLVVMMFVIEKRREIAILKAIGSSKVSIMRIFFAQGVAMGVVGSGMGLVLGLGFVGYCVYVGIPLPVEEYYIDRLPVEVNPVEIALVTLSALVVTIGATLLPALQAAKLDPVAGLRDDQDM